MNYHRAKRMGIPRVYRYYFQCKNWRVGRRPSRRHRSCSQKKTVRQEDVEAIVVEALSNRAKEVSQTVETPQEEPQIFSSPRGNQGL